MKTLFDKYRLPIYLPDATRGVVKSLDSSDLVSSGVTGVVVNTFHLMNNPGIDVLPKAGGIKKFMNFDGLVVSDSGGWQIFSLIQKSQKGRVLDEGVKFDLYENGKQIFTPEISIETQIRIGSDIVICLDAFTPPYSDRQTAEQSVKRTIKWAESCRKSYDSQIKNLPYPGIHPRIFAVVQGGEYKDLREQCYLELSDIGFDGYGFGGYPVDHAGNLDYDLSNFLADLIDNNFCKFALGIGRPKDIVKLSKMGWDIFDCTLPTRDARHKRLYVFTHDPQTSEITENSFDFIYISRNFYKNDFSPISEYCDCHLCKHYSKSYLWHLFKVNEVLAFRLASIHNLRIYTKIMELLQKQRP